MHLGGVYMLVLTGSPAEKWTILGGQEILHKHLLCLYLALKAYCKSLRKGIYHEIFHTLGLANMILICSRL